MCGICGVVGTAEADPVDPRVFGRMVESLRHRGPDDEGVYRSGPVALGCRRLSIIDLEGGHQPIPNEDGSLQIVFNGEIYNYRELALFLRRKGHQFRTRTDTEVILHLYEEFGPDCVQSLVGIFAFGIWDGRRRRLLLARDRMGVKPLYYAEVGDWLVFGSELKALLAHPGIARDVDLAALNQYLSFEYVPTPRTILNQVRRLEPGHTLCYGENGLQVAPYWQIRMGASERHAPVHWREYAEQLRQTLEGCVQQELVSDVPVGVLLSGGIDSSTIAALMAGASAEPVRSFTIGFEQDSFDESGYARQVARHLGTEHKELVVTSRMAVDTLAEIMSFQDEPFGDSSLIPTYLLCRFAREHVKVVLSGDGGDEMLAGYPTLLAHRLIEHYERLVPWRLRASLAPRILELLPTSFDDISFDFRVRRFLSGRGVPVVARHHRWLGSFMDEEKASLFEDWVKPILTETYGPAYEHARACDARLPLNQLLYVDMKMYLEGDILFKVDRASMAASLEVRVPFLNPSFVRFATELPVDLKLHGLTGKYLLRKSMRHRLPREILRRPKKGFNIPVAYWLAGDLRDLTLDMLSEARLKRQGIFRPSFVRDLLKEHFDHRRDNRKQLWTLLAFQLWYEKHMGPSAV